MSRAPLILSICVFFTPVLRGSQFRCSSCGERLANAHQHHHTGVCNSCHKKPYKSSSSSASSSASASSSPPLYRPGRPRKTSAAVDDSIIACARANPFFVNSAIAAQCDLNISQWTIMRRLREMNLPSAVARHAPPLTAQHRQKRVEWCQRFVNKAELFWLSCAYQDETAFQNANVGRQWVHRPPGKGFALDPRYTIPDRKAHPFRLNAVAVVHAQAIGFHLFHGGARLNAAKLIEIFMGMNLNSLHLLNCCEMLWDNASFHTSVLMKNFLDAQKIQPIQLPPYSPDLNPIENIFSIWKGKVKKRVREWLGKPPNVYESIVRDEGQKLLTDVQTQNKIRKTIASMPKRCAAVIAAQGFKIKY